MTTSAIHIDGHSQAEQSNRNLFDTVLLVACVTALTAAAGYLMVGWLGLFGAVLAVGLVAMGAPNIPASLVTALYRAQPMNEKNGRDVLLVARELADRAGLPASPGLYVIPSLTVSAFTVGPPGRPAIAVTEGLLRKLNLGQVAGVLAHELGHIRNNDLRLFALADAATRLLQILSWLSLPLIVAYLPQYFDGNTRVPLFGALLLLVAPAIFALLQQALSRSREYEADREAVALTDDPASLVSALPILERYPGHVWEDLIFPNCRRSPQPSPLRTHPSAAARIEHLRNLPPGVGFSPMIVGPESPRVSLVGLGPSAMRPRYRLPGLWF